MQVRINTDRHIEGHERLTAWAGSVVEQALSRVSDRITRVEVHLSETNADKSGQQGQRCMMEARLEGRQPIAATHQAATMDQAVKGAAEKLSGAIESIIERQRDQRRRPAAQLPEEVTPPEEETPPDEQ
ncbi:HPF/RaiA family ribosome-associated protein [Thiorhodococcus mannitoliphagus]|uniref:HPF/RaiA family ribosome-associated protein n=1 Tax=Thiorhodococcus mannitoliphagus TaxID=329406 RepID=A0A6P1DWD4_9GAMM|nr:HPF/RaiA family ribosome-associated protein [Thiorhodococcus mannitoliphagus]NEX19955.1 HPF/RaiA family ribosome-associated protein [Thiorhodococcus mannitoliphagus]